MLQESEILWKQSEKNHHSWGGKRCHWCTQSACMFLKCICPWQKTRNSINMYSLSNSITLVPESEQEPNSEPVISRLKIHHSLIMWIKILMCLLPWAHGAFSLSKWDTTLKYSSHMHIIASISLCLHVMQILVFCSFSLFLHNNERKQGQL